jgi:hypothetical protein
VRGVRSYRDVVVFVLGSWGLGISRGRGEDEMGGDVFSQCACEFCHFPPAGGGHVGWGVHVDGCWAEWGKGAVGGCVGYGCGGG